MVSSRPKVSRPIIPRVIEHLIDFPCSVTHSSVGLVIVALLDEYLPYVVNTLLSAVNVDLQAFGQEMSTRWPEVVGMVVGQLLILTFLFFAWTRTRSESSESQVPVK